ncbi:MAG TPA: dihydrolipoamide acetyltransferase family protein [Solirubrobacteraceae bacterium]|nr:dihydrolipoamide acetyltransferase family protein [Solirubrobacteraceae bacterium]
MSSSLTENATLVDVTMPQMGVSVAEGTIVAWRIGVGDRIEAEQTIVEISTDKIDSEVPAPVTGVLAEILVEPDQTVEVGTVLGRIAVGDGEAAPAPPSPSAPAADEPDAPAPAAAQAEPPAPAASRPAASKSADGRRYSPVVQRIAAEHGIDLASVTGTGRGGRVRKQDVLAVVNGTTPPAEAAPEPPMHIESPYRPDPDVPSRPRTPKPTPVVTGSDTDPPILSRMRRTIGERMKQSLDTAATCTTWIEADMAGVEAARARVGVTALAFVARATVETLREFPALNAWLNGEEYARVQDVNLGIAVSLGEDGLIVPVIHRAQELSVEGLAARIKDLAKRARARELAADEVLGGTFTITAPGQYGSIMATPVINQPQVGILDFEAVVKRPVVVTDHDGNDSIAIRPMTILGMSWDHRALDGALAAQFLAAVRDRLQAVR